MSLPKTEKIEASSNPLALVVGESEITRLLARRLEEEGCEAIELQDFPRSGKFNYIFQFGDIDKVRESHLKFLKLHGRFLFIDFRNEDVSVLKDIKEIKVLRIDNLSPWNFQRIIQEILKVTFTQIQANVIDLRENKPREETAKPEKVEKPDSVSSIQESTGIVQRSLGKPILFLILALALILSSGLGFFYWQAIIISDTVYNAQENFEKGNYSGLQNEIKSLNKLINLADKTVGFTQKNYSPLRNLKIVTDTKELVDSARDFTSSLNFTFSLLSEFSDSRQNLTLNDLYLTEVKFEELESALVRLSEDSMVLRKNLNNLNFPFIPKDSLTENLDRATSDLDSIAVTMPVLKKFLYAGNKEYLLLFQNNMELRATGGFIGSVGFLNLNNGRLNKLEISDVYTIDGQIKGHVDPPPEYRKYFNQPNFFLRDSNFDPDFAKSAIQAQWFLDKAVGRKVDGVIGVNLYLVQDLLEAVGPVTLSDFNNEVITSDNLFIKAQVFINQNFFPGSSQKKDFLSSVANALQVKLAGKNVPYLKIMRLIRNSLDEKNLLFYFNDISLQSDFENLGWAGRIVNIRCLNPGEKCYPDYISVNESNFGVNKANYFVNKSVFLDKLFDQNGTVTTELTLKYNNQSKNGLLQGGQYTNYLRIMLPKTATLVKSEFDNTNLDLGSFDVSEYGEDKNLYGTLIRIPENSSKTFRLTYKIPNALTQEVNSYQFYIQKQPGDRVSSLNLSFASSGFKFEPVNFDSEKGRINEFSYQSETSVDRVFQFKIIR